MKTVLPFLLVVLFFTLIPNYKPGEEILFEQLSNGCLIYALENKFLLDANERLQPYIWSRILSIQYYGKVGHAIHVFVYKNMTFVYDPAMGSYCISRYPIYDPLTIAEITYPDLPIKSAKYLEPTLLLNVPYRPGIIFQ